MSSSNIDEAFDRSGIPDELKARPQWVDWSLENRGGKTTKVPYEAGSNRRAKANDSATWATFEEASASGKDGVGFVFSSGDPYTGIDLDGCRDPETGEVEAWATGVLDELDGYSELSPSGTGFHIIVRGKLPRSGRRGKVEAYSSERFFTMTGNGVKREIPERQEQLDKFYKTHLEAPNPTKAPATSGVRSGDVRLSDDEVIGKLIKEPSGKGERLYCGDTGDYENDESRADLALVSKLYFYTQDSEQIDRIFRRSGLYREKWERTDYRHRTFMKAANSTTEVWQPGSIVKIGGSEGVTQRSAKADDGEPEKIFNTDLGNSYRFVRHFGRIVRYCYPWESWIIFDGKRWKPDTSGEIQRLGKEIPKEILREAADAPDDDTRKSLAKHALKTQSATRIRDMLALAKSDVPVQPEDFDRDPHLLNVANGTLDLKTGELKPHDRVDLITKLAPVGYDPEATAPTWAAFLERVLPSESVREFLKRLAGYSLTGDVSEHVLPVLFGVGANGKSTAVNAMLEAVGEYGIQAAPDLLMAKRGGHPTEVADLFGCRLASVTEVEDGRRLNEALVKQLTGGDRIRARRMRQDFWEFTPTHKAILSVNHKPEIRGTDTGIWRRIRLIPFTEVVPPVEQDKKLPEKLRRELPGVLRWMVEGCLQWQREGLNAPDEVRKATGQYRADMDVIGAFLTECCETGDEANVSAKDLYTRYRTWCEDNGETAVKQRKFGTQLTERNYTRYRGGASGGHRWKGLTLCKSSISRGSDPTDVEMTINGSKNNSRITIGKTGSDGSDGSVETSEYPADDLPNFGPSAYDRKVAERTAEAGWEVEDL